MTLLQYINNENLERLPSGSVELEKGEYKEGITITAKGGTETRTFIILTQFGRSEYVLINKSGVLWSTDKDGNPNNRSVFKINNL